MKKQTDISHMDRRTLLFTPDLIESFVNCRYKAYLKLAGQHGVISDFEAMVIERKDRVRTSLAQKLESRCGLHGVADGRQTTEASLHEGIEFLLECHLSTSNFSMHFDGLKKTDGTSALGPFHYIPVLLIGHHQIAKTHRAVAEIIGASLSGIQGRAPSYAIIYHGPNCQASRVSLSTASDSGKSMLTELVDLAKSLVVPRLLLNSHCELCEFQSKCRMQAIEEDNLSLLRGIGLREMTSYERRGILKLSQLAHTFRPKRKQKSGRRDLALQAMAIRDATVYVLGQPEIRPSAISVYVDIEFDPYDGYTYLLGMLVCADEQEEYHSFWAESKDEEERILEDFLATLSRYDSPMLFCYGAYERIWFERMRRTARSKELVDTMLPATINTLGLVYKHFYFPTYSNGLKHVGRFVGASWSDPQSSGLQSIVWHRKWDQSRDEIWKAKLMVYNCEDCSALRRVTDFIRTYSEHLPHNVEESTTNPMVVKVEQMSLPTYDTKWGRPQSAHQDFEFVNGRAYFDYQRQRVLSDPAELSERVRAKRIGRRDSQYGWRAKSKLSLQSARSAEARNFTLPKRALKALIGNSRMIL